MNRGVPDIFHGHNDVSIYKFPRSPAEYTHPPLPPINNIWKPPQYDFIKALNNKFLTYQMDWFCKKCGRWCPFCCGRTCSMCCIQALNQTDNFPRIKPNMYETIHEDGVFGPSKNPSELSHWYSVDPEWKSDNVRDHRPKPLNRPPWSWEQPRYRVNIHVPFCYNTPLPPLKKTDLHPNRYDEHNCEEEVPPLSATLAPRYRVYHPQYVMRY